MIYKDKFVDVYERWQRKELSCEEASELLHCSSRSFYRKRIGYKESGLMGVLDRRLNSIPHNKISTDKIATLLSLRREHPDYNLKHLHEEIIRNHEINQSYSSFRRILIMNGMFKIGRKPKKKHRIRRKPTPRPGIMIHQDGSTHNWLPNTNKKHDLIITMDDSNNEVYSAFLCDEEGTFSSFRGIRDVIEKRGLFHSFYVDRGSHYAVTKKAGEKVDKSSPTQVHRSLNQLGINIIHSYCPQGRGRSERMFATWQGRLPQELATNNIITLGEANKYIENVFLPKMNKIFMRKAELSGDDFVSSRGMRIKETLCVQEERRVNSDNTVSYKNKILQIPEADHQEYLARSKVKLHDYGDGILEIYHGLKMLARFIDREKATLLRAIDNKEYSYFKQEFKKPEFKNNNQQELDNEIIKMKVA